jgi:hypothetical protein
MANCYLVSMVFSKNNCVVCKHEVINQSEATYANLIINFPHILMHALKTWLVAANGACIFRSNDVLW